MERYLEIERIRFGRRLETDVRIDPEARGVRVPSLILQPLVENAIKHGMASAARPLRVDIHAAVDEGGLRIDVANELGRRRPPPADAGLGLGLDKVRDRLALAFGDGASLTLRREDGGFLSVVRIRPERAPADA